MFLRFHSTKRRIIYFWMERSVAVIVVEEHEPRYLWNDLLKASKCSSARAFIFSLSPPSIALKHTFSITT